MWVVPVICVAILAVCGLYWWANHWPTPEPRVACDYCTLTFRDGATKAMHVRAQHAPVNTFDAVSVGWVEEELPLLTVGDVPPGDPPPVPEHLRG